LIVPSPPRRISENGRAEIDSTISYSRKVLLGFLHDANQLEEEIDHPIKNFLHEDLGGIILHREIS
jgi:hypothetical protein